MSRGQWGDSQTQYFYELNPDHILTAIEELGLKVTGRIMQLNSMENRVYEIEIEPEHEIQSESERFVIAKFYRPGRWSKEQILEEHEFLFDLIEAEIQAIAPLKFKGESLFTSREQLLYCVFPKKGGRAADEWTNDLLEQMGRTLARVHSVGRGKTAHHRLKLSPETYGTNNLNYLLENDIIPAEYRSSYETLVKTIIQLSTPMFNGVKTQRVHGDCHHGNTLLSATGPFLIDFDDMVVAPPYRIFG
jgi:Ser/Thr protein kinase RdoA (MazF antagonist)